MEKIRPYNIESNEEVEGHRELSEAFKNVGLPLNSTLIEMLEESETQHSDRKGSGFTQASRYMADIIRKKRSSWDNLNIFDDTVRFSIEEPLLDKFDYTEVSQMDYRDYLDLSKLDEVAEKITKPGSQLLLKMIADITSKEQNDREQITPYLQKKIEIGTCTTAEVYFFDYFNDQLGKYSDSAKVNIFKDDFGEAVFVEKMGMGENHSAISLKEIILNGVRIPAGSLVALQYDLPVDMQERTSGKGKVLDGAILDGVDFLRFTTLVVEPNKRAGTFGKHFQWQIDNEISGAGEIQLEEFVDKCQREIRI